MNLHEVIAMQVERGRRCSESHLRAILLNTPIILPRTRGSKLRVNVGLGNIVYIQPVRGRIKDVKLGADVQEYESILRRENYVVFHYKGRRFDVQLN